VVRLRLCARELALLGLDESAPAGCQTDARCASGRADGPERGSVDPGWWLCRPKWHGQAACRGLGTAPFFLEDNRRRFRLAELCGGCPVAYECLSYGLENGCVGVWGGLVLNGRNR
jgi:hypothetical protein